MAPKRDRPSRQIDSKVGEEQGEREGEREEGMLNFDKDRRLLFQCRPFSNQWPAVFGNVILAGVALLLAESERGAIGLEKVREWCTGQLGLLTFTSGV